MADESWLCIVYYKTGGGYTVGNVCALAFCVHIFAKFNRFLLLHSHGYWYIPHFSSSIFVLIDVRLKSLLLTTLEAFFHLQLTLGYHGNRSPGILKKNNQSTLNAPTSAE